MEKSEYSKLLKHPKWQRKRLEILQRDNFTCQLCKDEESTLHIHHEKYIQENKPWEYENTNLTALCEDCHSMIEEYKNTNHSIHVQNCRILKIKASSCIYFFIIEKTKILRIVEKIEDSYYQRRFAPEITTKIQRFINKNINHV